MDRVILVLNVAACALLASAAAWAVLSDRVRDGVLVKAGLIGASLGFGAVGLLLAAGEGGQSLGRALGLLHGGLLLVAVCVAIRWRRTGRAYRVDEWINPPTVAQAARRVDAEDLQRASRL